VHSSIVIVMYYDLLRSAKCDGSSLPLHSPLYVAAMSFELKEAWEKQDADPIDQRIIELSVRMSNIHIYKNLRRKKRIIIQAA